MKDVEKFNKKIYIIHLFTSIQVLADIRIIKMIRKAGDGIYHEFSE